MLIVQMRNNWQFLVPLSDFLLGMSQQSQFNALQKPHSLQQGELTQEDFVGENRCVDLGIISYLYIYIFIYLYIYIFIYFLYLYIFIYLYNII